MNTVELEGLRGWRQGDGVAEDLKLVDQPAGLAFGIASGLVVVGAEVGEPFPGAEEVPDHVGEAVRDGEGRFVRASPVGDLAVLGAEVAGLGSGRGAGRLDEGAAQPPVPVGGADPAPLARGLTA